MKRVFLFYIDGFSAVEQRMISSMLKLASNRTREYISVTEGGSRAADILVVNSDVDNIKHHFYRVCGKPIITIGSKPSDLGTNHLPRPIIPTRLLKMLNTVTVKELDFSPEVFKSNERRKINRGNYLSEILEEPVKKVAPAYAKKLVLVVDDSKAVQQAVRIKLEDMGLEVVLAGTGEIGLEQLSQKKFDLIFLDVTLPGMDGYQVCKTIKAMKSTKRIPVCMLTGKTSSFNKIKGKISGCDIYLTKPVSVSDLVSAVHKYLPVTGATSLVQN